MLAACMRLPIVLLTLPCLLPLAASTAGVAGEPAPSDLRQALQRNELVSFISIHDYGRLKYEVDLLTPDGDLLEFEFNARDGSLLGIHGPNIERARRP